MTIQRIALFAILIFALVQPSTEATAGKRWVEKEAGPDGRCTCRDFNLFCIRTQKIGPNRCRVLVADTVEQAQQYKNTICQGTSGYNHVWHLYKCVSPEELADLMREINNARKAGKAACGGAGKFALNTGWEVADGKRWKCFDTSTTPTSPIISIPVEPGDSVGAGAWGN